MATVIQDNVQGRGDSLPKKSVFEFFESDAPVARLLKSRSPSNERRLYALGLRKGHLSPRECLVLMLPLRFFPLKRKYLSRQRESFGLEAKDELGNFLSEDGAVNLFGCAFYIPDYLDALGLVLQVVAFDQYHAARLVKRDSIVIDAGANIGPFSVFAARLASEGHVYAFEPTASTFHFLDKNRKGYPNLTCLNAGLGDEVAEKRIWDKGRGNLGNVMEDSPLFRRAGGGKGCWERVAVTTVDEFVSRNKLPRIDFIKIDTEGYEGRILRGAEGTIRKFGPVIAMSAYHDPEDRVELPRLLRSIRPDYECELSEDVEEDFICRVYRRDSRVWIERREH